MSWNLSSLYPVKGLTSHLPFFQKFQDPLFVPSRQTIGETVEDGRTLPQRLRYPVPVLHENLDPHCGIACRNPAGVTQSLPRKSTVFRILKSNQGTNGRENVGQMADAACQTIMLTGAHHDRSGSKAGPEPH